jgi:putative zinc finger/helix-turn-helix YgiT family protein
MRKAAKSKAGAGCVECGTPMRSHREAHRYTITPTWAITIEDAEILRCPKCGTWEVVIPKSDALQRTIAAEVIRKSTPLAGPEVTFLRRCLGLNGRELARALGIENETLSRYEHGSLRVQPQVDRLLRMMVAAQFLDGGERFGVEALSSIEKDVKQPAPLKLVVTVGPKGTWRRAAT